MHHPVVSVKTYLSVFAVLMVLTALTVYVAFIDFGHGLLNDLVAMTIAVIKALFVLVIFMHLKYSARILWLIAGSSVVWLIVMIGLTLTDYRSREWIESQLHRGAPWTSQPPLEQPAAPAPSGGGH
jgi:cytochrome c oxidase subunit 4